jgi:hypothetical protein
VIETAVVGGVSFRALLARRVPDAWREIACWWLGSRLLVVATCLVAQTTGFVRPGWRPGFDHPLALLGSWDARWYRIVAERGYLLVQGRFSDPAFFPLLPVLERAGMWVGLSPVVAGVLLANAGFLAGLVLFYRLGRELLPEGVARRAAIYLAVFPFSFVFSMAYPEGVVLPLVALTGLFALRDRWLAAGACVALATLARPEGLLLSIPVVAVAAAHWPRLTAAARAKAVAASLAGMSSLVAFSLNLWWTVGDPLAWGKAEHAWGRSFSVAGPWEATRAVATALQDHNPWLYRDVAFCAVYVVLLVVALRAGVPRSWVAAGAAMVLIPLASGSFTSDGRFGLLALPVFWGLATLGGRRWPNRVIVASSCLLLAGGVLSLPLRFP